MMSDGHYKCMQYQRLVIKLDRAACSCNTTCSKQTYYLQPNAPK